MPNTARKLSNDQSAIKSSSKRSPTSQKRYYKRPHKNVNGPTKEEKSLNNQQLVEALVSKDPKLSDVLKIYSDNRSTKVSKDSVNPMIRASLRLITFPPADQLLSPRPKKVGFPDCCFQKETITKQGRQENGSSSKPFRRLE